MTQASDPGILISIYYPAITSYPIPGPVRLPHSPTHLLVPLPIHAALHPLPNQLEHNLTPLSPQRPFTCGSGSGSQPTTPAAPTTQRTSTTLAKSTRTTSAAATTSSASTGAGAALYGQCGGIGWAGPKTCATGRCVANGDYYSQCVP